MEETFVGKAYADVALPSGVDLFYYHGDHLGSANVITDHTGAQVRLQEYKPLGTLNRATGSKDLPHKFTGQRLDDTTGLC